MWPTRCFSTTRAGGQHANGEAERQVGAQHSRRPPKRDVTGECTVHVSGVHPRSSRNVAARDHAKFALRGQSSVSAKAYAEPDCRSMAFSVRSQNCAVVAVVTDVRDGPSGHDGRYRLALNGGAGHGNNERDNSAPSSGSGPSKGARTMSTTHRDKRAQRPKRLHLLVGTRRVLCSHGHRETCGRVRPTSDRICDKRGGTRW